MCIHYVRTECSTSYARFSDQFSYFTFSFNRTNSFDVLIIARCHGKIKSNFRRSLSRGILDSFFKQRTVFMSLKQIISPNTLANAADISNR